MTLTIAFTTEEEARIHQEAAHYGLDTVEYARRRILGILLAPVKDPSQLSVEEFDQILDELAEGSENLPVLPPEAFTREFMYEGRY